MVWCFVYVHVILEIFSGKQLNQKVTSYWNFVKDVDYIIMMKLWTLSAVI